MESGGVYAQPGRNRPRNGGPGRMMMKLSTLIALAGIVVIIGGGYDLVAASAKPISYKLPDETATFKPGPNLEAVQNNGTACHSADYIQTQPEGPKIQEGLLAGRSDQDDQTVWRTDRRRRCRQDCRLPCRDLLRKEVPGGAPIHCALSRSLRFPPQRSKFHILPGIIVFARSSRRSVACLLSSSLQKG